MRLSCIGITHSGRRTGNQDAVVLPNVGLLEDGVFATISTELTQNVVLVALADGVGGRPDGRWASHTALSALVSHEFTQNSTAMVAVAIAKANRALSGRATIRNGPATTLAGLAFNRDSLNVFHVGDSRVYEIGRTAVKMLTNDHRSRTDGRSITRYLGSDAHAIPAISAIGPPVAGTTYLISTDGFHGFLRDTDLSLVNEVDRAFALSALFEMALENGSNDNLSAVVVVVE